MIIIHLDDDNLVLEFHLLSRDPYFALQMGVLMLPFDLAKCLVLVIWAGSQCTSNVSNPNAVLRDIDQNGK